ncbi:hypothetical protein Tco_1551660, partial [Tanacetum coccineum]
LLHVNLFREISIKEGSFDIHFLNLIVIKCGYGYKNPNSSNVCNRREGFLIINPWGLSIALRHKTSFIGVYSSIHVALLLEEPLATNGFAVRRKFN